MRLGTHTGFGVSPRRAAALGLVTGSSSAGARGEREREGWEGGSSAWKGDEAAHKGELQYPARSRTEINPSH